MHVEDLLHHLKSAGIRLWLDTDIQQLKFEAPKGALTQQLRSEIQASKPEIIAFLQNLQADSSKQDDIALSAMDRSQGVSLSFAQQRLWFLYQLEGKSVTYNISACRRLHGPLDLDCLQKSLIALAQRHEILRTNFQTVKDEAQQIIHPARAYKIALHDIQNTSDDNQKQAIKNHIAQESGYAFELETDHLLRLSLLKTGQDEYILMLVLHHIIGDGWSLEILIRELTTIYEAIKAGKDHDLPALALQYGDFALWQRKWVEKGGLDRQLSFWKSALDGMAPLLSLPYDRQRPARQNYNGGLCFFDISNTQKEKLESFTRSQNASLYMGLCSVLNVLIHKYMGHDDIVIGTHTAGRTRKEQEALIGFFINTLPLRTDISGDPNFKTLLGRVAKSARNVFSHQDVPFEKLVDIVQPERDMSYAPLVQVMCVLQNMPISRSTIDQISVETIELDRDSAKFDLSLLMEEGEDALHCEFEYNADLFDHASIQRMARHFENLLDRLLEDPECPISGISLLGVQEEKHILEELSQPLPSLALNGDPKTINDAFDLSVTHFSDKAALVHKGRILTYGMLNREANRLAHHLITRGLMREDIVALHMETSPQLIIAMLAVLKAGGCYLPLDTQQPETRRLFILKDANAKFVLSEEPCTLSGLEDRWINISDRPDDLPAYNPVQKTTPQQLAYIIYTSGSTGTPKGVMIEHQSVIDLIASLNGLVYGDFEKGRNIALMAAPVFDASVQQIYAALLLGHCLHLVDPDLKQNTDGLLDFLKHSEIHLSDATPTLLNILLTGGLAKRNDLSLTHLLVGGEALNTAQCRQLDNSPIQVINVYGPSETCVDVTAFTFDRDTTANETIVPIGRAIGNARAYILDPQQKPVPIGIDGELYVSGKGVFRGYVNLEERTKAVRIPNPFANPDDRDHAFLYRTGDICHWRSDGEIAYIGRNDNQVKIRGYRIELGDIEANLAIYPNVRKVAVLACKNTLDVNELHAFLETDHALNIADLHTFLKQRLADYMIPAKFYGVKEIKQNKSGKIDRNALIQLAAQTTPDTAKKDKIVAPMNADQKILCSLFTDVLGLKDISITDNFFYLGGDSIKALQIVARLNQQNLRLEVRDIFTHPRIEELATKLKKASPTTKTFEIKKGHEIPLSAIQRWYFDTYKDQNLHFNQSVLLEACRQIDKDALHKAIEGVLKNHDAFYLKLKQTKDGYRQFYDQVDFGFLHFDLTGENDPKTRMKDECLKLQQSIHPERLLIQAALFALPTTQYIFICAHHLIIDAVSWRTLFEELEQAYDAVKKNAPITLSPPPLSFGDWMDEVVRFTQHDLSGQLAFWQDINKHIQPVDGPNITHGDCQLVETRMDKAQTAQLLGVAHESYNTGMDDLLLAALGRALTRFDPKTCPVVMLESHGRETLGQNIHIGTNVGWLTSMYPVHLQTADLSDGALIKHIKERLRQIPQKGIGYGFLSQIADDKTTQWISPQISFNYLGQFGAEEDGRFFKLSLEDVAPNISPKAVQPFKLEFVALVVHGCLELKIGYSTRHYTQEQTQNLLTSLKNELEALLAHVISKTYRELTPSDIDYDGFTQDELDQFIDSLDFATSDNAEYAA